MFKSGDQVSVETRDVYGGSSGTVIRVFEDGCTVHLMGWIFYEDGYFFEFNELRKAES